MIAHRISRRRISFPISILILAALTASPAASQTRSGGRQTAAVKDQAAQTLALERQLLKATSKVNATYLKDIGAIVAWAAANGLPEEARELLQKMKRIDPGHEGIEALETKVAAAKASDDPTAARKSLESRLRRAGSGHARRLFDLAKQCMKVGLFTRAYELVKDVIEVDPDHRQARSVLSYAWDSKTKTWITKWEAQMKKAHYLTPEGWVPLKDKSKWEKGLRPYRGNWVPEAEERQIRQRNNFAPYEVETEHFVVRTNLGREQAFQFAQRLEDFYRAFFEFFVGFYDQVRGAELLFNVPKLKKNHVVEVFPSRVDYLDFVRAEKGNDELLRRSGGFWSSGDAKSYFFWTEDPKETLGTLYHETTHQLFGETKPQGGSSKGNVWIVEGIATYMETWEKIDEIWRPGYKIEDDSLQLVRSFLASNPGWRLGGYIGLEHKQFHDPKGRGLHYALGGALSHFFLHYRGGIYREDFIQLIRAYYDGKLREGSLPNVIRVEGADGATATLATIEKQFREYMKDLKRPGEEPEDDGAEAGPDSEGGSQK